MSNLTILNTSVRSLGNLYSLTDLHRLSGGEERHRPSHFLRLDQTKDLISAIESENSNVQICTFKIIRGGQGGTYACEELALAYATWISPKFHLVVLRAFIAMHKGETLQKNHEIRPLVEPEQTYTFQLTKYELKSLAWLWFALYKCLELLDIIHKPLEALGSRFGVTAYTHATEYRNTLNAAHSTVKRLTDGLENEWGNAIPAIRKHQVTGLARIAR